MYFINNSLLNNTFDNLPETELKDILIKNDDIQDCDVHENKFKFKNTFNLYIN